MSAQQQAPLQAGIQKQVNIKPEKSLQDIIDINGGNEWWDSLQAADRNETANRYRSKYLDPVFEKNALPDEDRNDILTEFNKKYNVGQVQTNFLTDLLSHSGNALAGYTQDDAIRSSGSGAGSFLGDALGGLGYVAGGTLAGAGLGTIVPGIGNVVGGLGGGIAAAGAGGTLQDLQTQRLEGAQNPNYGRALISGGIQGGLQGIPAIKGASLAGTLGKNLLTQGAGAGLGSYAQQGVEQGTFTPNLDVERLKREVAFGAGGGLFSGLPAGQQRLGQPRQARPKQRPLPKIEDARQVGYLNKRTGQVVSEEGLAAERFRRTAIKSIDAAATKQSVTTKDTLNVKASALKSQYEKLAQVVNSPQATPRQKAVARRLMAQVKQGYTKVDAVRQKPKHQQQKKREQERQQRKQEAEKARVDKAESIRQKREYEKQYKELVQQEKAAQRQAATLKAQAQKLQNQKDSQARQSEQARLKAESQNRQRELQRLKADITARNKGEAEQARLEKAIIERQDAQRRSETTAAQRQQNQRELIELRAKLRQEYQEQSYRNKQALQSQKGKPTVKENLTVQKGQPEGRSILNPAKKAGKTEAAPKETKLPGMDSVADHPEIKRRPEIIANAEKSYLNNEKVKLDYMAEKAGTEVDKPTADGVVIQSIGEVHNIEFENGQVLNSGRRAGQIKQTGTEAVQVTDKNGKTSTRQSPRYGFFDKSGKQIKAGLKLEDVKKAAKEHIRKTEQGEIALKAIDSEGQFRTYKLFDGQGDSLLNDVKLTGKTSKYQSVRDIEDILKSGEGRARVLDTETGELAAIFKPGRQEKSSTIRAAHEKMDQIVATIKKGGKAKTSEVLDAAAKYDDINELQADLDKLSPEARRELHKKLTGENC